MRVSDSYVCLKGARFHAFHGVLPQERRVGDCFIVDLRVGYHLQVAMESDEVQDTLNYASLYEIVKSEMSTPSSLLEHVAGRIASAIEKAFPQVTSVELLITKQNPPMGADCEGAAVEIHLINDKTRC